MNYPPSLSLHISFKEAVFSSTANRLEIDNATPSQSVLDTAIKTAFHMEEIRVLLGNKPIHIDSFIRCIELNRALKSKDTSQHVLGQAVDFLCDDFGTPLAVCKAIVQSNMSFDQLILEHSWVHISFAVLEEPKVVSNNRRQVLSLLATGHYSVGLTDKYGKEV